MKSFIISVECPHGGTEFLGDRGKIITEAQARANPVKAGDMEDAQTIAEYRARIWSANNDCHVKNLQVSEL